jgi:hypothetical protein
MNLQPRNKGTKVGTSARGFEDEDEDEEEPNK